jgi:site-specific recombinase XerD
MPTFIHEASDFNNLLPSSPTKNKSHGTKRAYNTAWEKFIIWCKENSFSPLPSEPATVANFILYLANTGKYKVSTIEQHLVSISQMHKQKGFQYSPTSDSLVRNTFKEIQGNRSVDQNIKHPLLTDDILALLNHIPATLTGYRDKALLLLGFSGALRPLELSSLYVEHLSFQRDEGMSVLIRVRNQDCIDCRQIAILKGRCPATCPLNAVQEWIKVANLMSGPLFRAIDKHGHISPQQITSKTISNIIKKYCKLSGKNTSTFAGLSLKYGFITTALEAGASESAIMKQAGYQSIKTIKKYIRKDIPLDDNASKLLGL